MGTFEACALCSCTASFEVWADADATFRLGACGKHRGEVQDVVEDIEQARRRFTLTMTMRRQIRERGVCAFETPYVPLQITPI